MLNKIFSWYDTFSIYLSIDSKTLKKTQPFIADD